MSWYEDEKEWEMAKTEMNDILRKAYTPDMVVVKPHPLIVEAIRVKPTRWKRLKVWVDGVRFRLGCWIAGAYLGDEDDDSCD